MLAWGVLCEVVHGQAEEERTVGKYTARVGKLQASSRVHQGAGVAGHGFAEIRYRLCHDCEQPKVSFSTFSRNSGQKNQRKSWAQVLQQALGVRDADVQTTEHGTMSSTSRWEATFGHDAGEEKMFVKVEERVSAPDLAKLDVRNKHVERKSAAVAPVALGLRVGLIDNAWIPSMAEVDSLTYLTMLEHTLGPVTAKLADSRAAGKADFEWQKDNTPLHAGKSRQQWRRAD